MKEILCNTCIHRKICKNRDSLEYITNMYPEFNISCPEKVERSNITSTVAIIPEIEEFFKNHPYEPLYEKTTVTENGEHIRTWYSNPDPRTRR